MASNQLVTVDDYEKLAQSILPKSARDYYSSGANDETTLKENRNAFERLRIRPRFLRDVSLTDTSTIILGSQVSTPIGVAPTAMQGMAHPEGEVATARAAGAAGSIFILSTLSTKSLEEVAAAAPNTTKWFQLYIYKDREVTHRLVTRAERAGFKAIVLTIDAPSFGQRNADIRNNFKLPSHLRLANFSDNKATDMNCDVSGSGINEYVKNLFDQSVTWDDVKWLKSITQLPIVLKGILTAEDAVMGADLGVQAIQVSNHGGRQVDGTPASIEALVEISRAVGHRVEIYLDGGVRKGTDVLKALALGARMVFAGRPALWGLAQGGEDGVKDVLRILGSELVIAMKLTGCVTVKDIVKDMVVHESFYSRL